MTRQHRFHIYAMLTASLLFLIPHTANAATLHWTQNVATLRLNPSVVTAQQVNAYDIELITRVNGVVVGDHHYGFAFSSAEVTHGVQDARTVLTNVAGAGAALTTPSLLSEALSAATARSAWYTYDRAETTTSTITFGPGRVWLYYGQIGQDPWTGEPLGTCADVIARLPAPNRPWCDTMVDFVELLPGDQIVVNSTSTRYYVNETFIDTTTTTLTQSYALDATIEDIASIYTAVPSGLYDLARGFQRRLLTHIGEQDESGGIQTAEGGFQLSDRLSAWMNVYDSWSAEKSRSGVEGDSRNQHGVAAGFVFRARPYLSLGLAIGQDWQKIALDASQQSGDTHLTQVGMVAAFSHGDFEAAVSATYGTGAVRVTHGPADWTSVASPKYTVWAGAGRIGYETQLQDIHIVPEALVYLSVSRHGAISETGGTALNIDSRSDRFAEVALGVRAYGVIEAGGTDWTLSGWLHGTDLLSEAKRDMSASLVEFPTIAVANHGLSEDQYGGELGIGVAVDLFQTAKLYVDFQGEQRGGYRSLALSAGLNIPL